MAWGESRHAEGKFAELRLPNLLKRWNFTHFTAQRGKVYGNYAAGKMRGVQKWRKLAKRLPAIERALHEWEVANPDLYQALPWYEQREDFKEKLAAGEVVWPTWWELAGAVNHMNWFGRVMSPEKMQD